MSFPDLSLEDLFIAPAEYAGLDLLAEWRWIVPAEFVVHRVGLFGDSFLIAPDGVVFFLDFLEGDLIASAPHVESMMAQLHCPDAQRHWLSSDWVAMARESGLRREPGQCYGWKIAPILGGPANSENIQLFSLPEYFSNSGQVIRQARQNPESSRVAGFTADESAV